MGASGTRARPGPFLKWAGGKSQILEQFASLYPGSPGTGRYIEPFLGGGAVFFHVMDLLRPSASFLSDDNEALIDTYLAVRDDVENLIRHLARHRKAHCREHYYRVRARNHAGMPLTARAARLIYLNRTCFNGLYRVNASGGFNVPMGRYEEPRILDAQNLRAASAALAGSSIRAAHFRSLPGQAREGDFIYLDPPYHPLSKTASFTSYTRGSFSTADQEELAAVYATLARRGCRVMLSNSDCALIRSLYREFNIHTVMARRSINSDPARRGAIAEVVVLNYEPGPVTRAGRVSKDASPPPRQARQERLPPAR